MTIGRIIGPGLVPQGLGQTRKLGGRFGSGAVTVDNLPNEAEPLPAGRLT